MFEFLNSASAISAAFFIDSAATPALLCAERGKIRATRTWRSPTEALAAASLGWGVGAPPFNCVVQVARTVATAAMSRLAQMRFHACASASPLRDIPVIVAPRATDPYQWYPVSSTLSRKS